MKFTELNLKPEIQTALDNMGYTDLTPIQEATFSLIMDGRDILGLAETGSGKTSACAIPLVQKVDAALREIQVLVLVPTRELAQQYVDEIDRICSGAGIEAFAIFGGFSMPIQKGKLLSGVHLLVATPGRLIDHIYSDNISLKHVNTVILDEADEMLNMGFIDDVKFLMSCVINPHQTLFFSATMPKEITQLVEEELKDPVRIELNKSQRAPQNLVHSFSKIHHEKRVDHLIEYLQDDSVKQALIFCNAKIGTEKLCRELKDRGIDSVDYIHGGLDQEVRTRIFNKFRENRIRVLMASDVAGRGLDFSHVTHVINFDFPQSFESYTHRTGRTGRNGRSGIALTYITRRDEGVCERLILSNDITPVWIDGNVGGEKKSRNFSEHHKATPQGSGKRDRYGNRHHHRHNETQGDPAQNKGDEVQGEAHHNSPHEVQGESHADFHGDSRHETSGDTATEARSYRKPSKRKAKV